MAEGGEGRSRGIEATIAELAAQVRGLRQAQQNRSTSSRQKKGQKHTPPQQAQPQPADEQQLALRQRVLQCELEDLTEENNRLRARIRQMMLAQRDTNLTCVMLVAFALLVCAILYQFVVRHHHHHHGASSPTPPPPASTTG